jgi:hypothetical protein
VATGAGKNGYDILARTGVAPALVNGHKIYDTYVILSVGYRNNKAISVATGDNPKGIYAVLSGTHYNNSYCFDYGNAETDNTDPGAGYIETLYFENRHIISTRAGNGPWIEADLENGLYSKGAAGENANDLSIAFDFVTAIGKGNSGNQWAIRGGNSESNSLSTYYNGVRPPGYSPMKKQGAIVRLTTGYPIGG